MGGLNLLDPHNWTEEDETSSNLPFFDTPFLSHTVDGLEIPDNHLTSVKRKQQKNHGSSEFVQLPFPQLVFSWAGFLVAWLPSTVGALVLFFFGEG